MAQGAQLAALWWPRWMGGVWVGGGPKREGIYVYIELIHFVGQQKLTQHCKITLPQLKKLLISHVWIFTNDSHKSTQKKKTSLCSNILWNPSKSYLSFGFSPQRLKSGWLYNLEKLKEVNFLKEIMRNCPLGRKVKLLSRVQLFVTPWTVALSVHGIFQARVPEWVAISFSRGSSQPREDKLGR